MKYSVDVESYNLAVHFLQDQGPIDEEVIKRFAQHIQDAVEDFMSAEFDPTPDDELGTGRDRDEWKHEAAGQQRLK